MQISPSAKYGFRIRTRSGAVVDNLLIFGRDEPDAVSYTHLDVYKRQIIGCFFVKANEGGKIMNALYRGLAVAGALALIAFYPVTTGMLGDGIHLANGTLILSLIHI